MASWESQDDDRLLVAAVADPDAFATFYRRYERPMLAYFMRRVCDPELAADLTAEVFAAALRRARATGRAARRPMPGCSGSRSTS